MRFQVVAIDKLRNKHCRALAKDYLERLNAYGKSRVDELKPSSDSDTNTRKEEESDALLQRADSNAVLVVLDERGEHYTSSELADMVREDMLRGRSRWTLLIGGADGHAASLRSRANRVWSLSAGTLPHELARVVALEQLYRAMTIINGEPYHRE